MSWDRNKGRQGDARGLLGRLLGRVADDRGASILYALMFMLVALVVSAVTLGAATTMARRVSDDRAWKQERLTLDSAGDVAREMLLKTSFRIQTVREDGVGGNAETEVLEAEGPLAELLEDTLVTVAEDRYGVSANPAPLTISVDGFPDVVMTYTMSIDETDLVTGESSPQDRYRIKATLRIAGNKQSLLLDAYQSNVSTMEVVKADGVTTITEDVRWSDITVGTYARTGA